MSSGNEDNNNEIVKGCPTRKDNSSWWLQRLIYLGCVYYIHNSDNV